MIKVQRELRLKNVEITAIERHPVPVLGKDYRVKIIYKNIKIAELDVQDSTIKISLPNKYKKGNNKQILDLAIDKMYEEIAKVELENAMEKLRLLLGFAPEDYRISKFIKGFGKCENNKITINYNVVKYSRKVIEYVVLHEYCHLKYKSHCRSFYELLSKYEPDYDVYEDFLNN